jgi:phospholipid transport system substrate-binding protein
MLLEKFESLLEVLMRRIDLFRGIGFLLLILGIAVPGLAGEPTDQVKRTTDKILSIVSDPTLKAASKAGERRKRIRSAVDERFDWEEMVRRSLARHWAQRTDEEKKEFVRLFGELLEQTYLDKVEGYSGEKVQYEGETIDGDYAVVKLKIITKKNVDIPVEYRLNKKGSEWLVYDLSIEGVSLINNYRTQFNSIISESSYGDLVKRLKAKAAQR